MPLPPDVEDKLAACEEEVAAMRRERLDIGDSIDELISCDGGDDDAIPEETFDDPSVVREVERLQRVEQRVTRSSTPPASVPVPLRAGSR